MDHYTEKTDSVIKTKECSGERSNRVEGKLIESDLEILACLAVSVAHVPLKSLRGEEALATSRSTAPAQRQPNTDVQHL